MQNTPAENMVLGQILTNDVLDQRILTAMAHTPRELFVPPHLRGAAYVDEDLPLEGDRALMAPMTFARLIHLAEIKPESRVLNIGCLSGYSAAVLAQLSAHVVATELDAKEARDHLDRLNLANVSVQDVTSLADGYAASAPYDVIVISGAVEIIPDAVFSQLAKDGRLAAVRLVAERPGAPCGLGKGLIVRRIHNQFYPREFFDTGATLLPGFERKATFRF